MVESAWDSCPTPFHWGISVILLGTNARGNFSQPEGAGLRGAGDHFGWRGFKLHTRAPIRLKATITSGQELLPRRTIRVGAAGVEPAFDSFKFDSAENVRIDSL